MKQEDINDLLWKSTPEWQKRQILAQKGASSQFAHRAITAMSAAVKWLEDACYEDDHIIESWYWQMKDLLGEFRQTADSPTDHQ